MIRAFHASPYRFDLFDNSFIGTGERAQMFGWGLYFTDTLNVARHYQKTIRRRSPTIYYDDQPITFVALGRLLGFNVKQRQHDLTYEWRCLGRIIQDSERDEKSIAEITHIEVERHVGNPRIQQIFANIGEKLEGHIRFGEQPSFVYEVEIDTTIDHLLLYEQPCEQQSPYVQKILARRCKQGESGSDLYHRLANRLGENKYASVAFVKFGIPGLRYPDQLSRFDRNDVSNSYNYVIFDPHLIKIVRRFRK